LLFIAVYLTSLPPLSAMMIIQQKTKTNINIMR